MIFCLARLMHKTPGKYQPMENRVLGIILSILGIVGLILAGYYFMNGGEGTRNLKSILLYGALGAIFFFAGIGLVRNTKDRAT